MPKERCLYIPATLILNETYRALSSDAQRLLLFFRGKPKHNQEHPNFYKTVFTFPYRELERYKFKSKDIPMLLKELEDAGFVLVLRGGKVNGNIITNKYQLSSNWEK